MKRGTILINAYFNFYYAAQMVLAFRITQDFAEEHGYFMVFCETLGRHVFVLCFWSSSYCILLHLCLPQILNVSLKDWKTRDLMRIIWVSGRGARKTDLCRTPGKSAAQILSEHMGLVTPHQAFPLGPAKLIQEWLSSSDTISRQNNSASLNLPSVLICQVMKERRNKKITA